MLEELVGFNLQRANQRIVQALTAELAQLEFRPHQFTALSIVVDNAGIIQSALAPEAERGVLLQLLQRLGT